jgi:ATP-dependent DNA helicase DinG
VSNENLKEIQEKIEEFYQAVQVNWPGFKTRVGQEQMFEHIAQTLSQAKSAKDIRDGDNILVVEGKTGVGKTLGYLIPAIVFSKLLNKRSSRPWVATAACDSSITWDSIPAQAHSAWRHSR